MLRVLICFLCVSLSWTSPSPQDLGSRILGGNYAREGQFPWQVALFEIVWGLTDLYVCGGSIISPEWILTAAHCLNGQSYRVLAGTINMKDTRNAIEAIDFRKHEAYYGAGYNDIGVLKLRYPLNFNQNIKSIKLSSQMLPDNFRILVSGWGRTPQNGVYVESTYLLYVDLVSNETCLRYNWPYYSNYQVFCATSDSNIIKDTCSGDSGGPAVAFINGDYQQEGVVSFGDKNPCGTNTVFTRVSYHRSWIQRNTMV